MQIDRPLFRNDRGLVTQLDFLTSMIIRVFGMGLLLAASLTVIYGSIPPDHSSVIVAERGASRLADDLLVTVPGDDLLDRACTEGFFGRETSVCGFTDDWLSGDSSFLNEAVGVGPGFRLNVTIQTTNGRIAEVNGTRLALGGSPPRDHGTVATWHRQVGLASTPGGGTEWLTLTVRVWE